MYIKSNMVIVDDNYTLAVGQVILEGELTIDGVRLMKRKDHPENCFLSFPRYKKSNGSYADLAYPLDEELRKQIFQAVMDDVAYQMVAQSRDHQELKVSVYPIADDFVKATASIELDSMVIKGIRILEGRKGMYIRMPQGTNGKDLIYPRNKMLRSQIQSAILREYEKEMLR